MDQAELQLGGGASDGINFEFIPYTDRCARRFGVLRRVFTTCLSQTTNTRANRRNIAQRIENGLRRAVLRQVLSVFYFPDQELIYVVPTMHAQTPQSRETMP